MKENEIEENNILLAEFMGKEVVDKYFFNETTNAFGLGTKTLTVINYHKSWDSLMDVWAKMFKELTYFTPDTEFQMCMDHFKMACLTVNVNKAFTVVASMVKWYNRFVKNERERA